MKACRTASVVAMGALLGVTAVGACREPAAPESVPLAKVEPPVDAKFVDLPEKLHAGVCRRTLVAVADGAVTALGETLAAGDVLVVTHGEPFGATGPGRVLWAEAAVPSCAARPAPAAAKLVIRGAATPKLEWAGGAMSARLDVASGPNAPSPSPELYLGRLEGTAGVAEHDHATSWEILAALDAKGTFTRGTGERRTEARLRPGEIVFIPPGTKHSWRPDPGSKLVAIQLYTPPGPEQRFVGLAAAEKAAVKDAGPSDAH